MNEIQNKINIIENLKNEVFDDKIVTNFGMIKRYINEILEEELLEYENIKNTYLQMLKYFGKNIEDEKRVEILNQTKLKLALICDKLIEKLKANNTSSTSNIYFYYNKKSDFQSITNNYLSDFSLFDNLFQRIVLQDTMDIGQKVTIQEIFENKKIPQYQIIAFVSAITISLIRFYDENKFFILIDLFKDKNSQISMRALTGIIIAMSIHEKKVSVSSKLYSSLKLLNDEPNYDKVVELVILQLLKSLETEQIITQFEQEILPKMMKMGSQIDEITKEDDNEDLFDDENPKWDKLIDKDPEFFEKMQDFTAKQLEGSDIFSATLGSMKQFFFFDSISNWFIPFSISNPEISSWFGDFKNDEFLEHFFEVFEKAGYLCNSDKYSLCLYLNNMPKPVAKQSMKLLLGEIQAAVEAMESNEIDPTYRNKRDIVVQYIQDLYRFFNFNKNVKGYENIFKKNITPLTTSIVSIIDNYLQITDRAANLLFSIKQYNASKKVLEKLIELGENTPENYERLAFCYQKEKNYNLAIVNYKKVELFDYDKTWMYNKLAKCYYNIGDYRNALEYFKKVDELKPQNLNILLNIGRCLFEVDEFSEALNYFFKANYYFSEDINAMRYIGYSSYKIQKFETAQKYLNKCAEKTPIAFDFLLLGNICWINKDKSEAINYYITACRETTIKFFNEMWEEQAEYLLSTGISQQELNLTKEYVLYNISDKVL